MKKFESLRDEGHWPTLFSAFLYFDVSFMVWTMLGALGAQIGVSLGLTPQQKGLMVAVPILGGAILRIVLGLLSDRFGSKRVGIIAQLVVIVSLACAWILGLQSYHAVLAMGAALGLAGASFAVALPQAGRWYPPHMQGVVLGLAGAGNMGVVLDALIAPRLAVLHGWNSVFGYALIPTILTLVVYALFSKDAPGAIQRRRLQDYIALLREADSHWFCFLYTVSFGGFVGLASSFVIYFTGEYHLSPVVAGEFAALCTFVGALARPLGGALADRWGGINALSVFYCTAAAALAAVGIIKPFYLCVSGFLVASGSMGMANGAVFQLLAQRFKSELNIMTGLVGCGGGLGGFILASSLGFSKGLTGAYTGGLLAFSALCALAFLSVVLVGGKWRASWGALAGVRV